MIRGNLPGMIVYTTSVVCFFTLEGVALMLKHYLQYKNDLENCGQKMSRSCIAFL